ncbi:MAG TPA: YMGG-like glycine zipper-containing protein, partial [Cytophagaceae bacterium]|nr:YMGG-like glycine zipper-containing protein [Cytophagaceae bacterium]
MKSINNFWKQIYLVPILVGGLAISGFAQSPGGGTKRQQDENFCRQQASYSGKHKTLKDAGIGAVGGAVAGKVFHKPGVGAAAGAAAGGIYGHRKSNNGS